MNDRHAQFFQGQKCACREFAVGIVHMRRVRPGVLHQLSEFGGNFGRRKNTPRSAPTFGKAPGAQGYRTDKIFFVSRGSVPLPPHRKLDDRMAAPAQPFNRFKKNGVRTALHGKKFINLQYPHKNYGLTATTAKFLPPLLSLQVPLLYSSRSTTNPARVKRPFNSSGVKWW